MTWFYHLSRFFCLWLLKLQRGFTVQGRENIPQDGGVLVVSNHRSNWDVVVVGCALTREVHFLAKEELFHIPIVNYIIRGLKAFPIKRGGADRQAIRKALNLMEAGKMVGIFPEGTRSKDGKLGQALPGAGLLALKSGAVLLPIAIAGTEKKKGAIQVIIGKPICLPAGKPKTEEISELLLLEIGKLLEKSYQVC